MNTKTKLFFRRCRLKRRCFTSQSHLIIASQIRLFSLLFAFVCFCLPWCIPGSLLNSTTWHIKQDGTGNFTTIQEGIDASADSDTVLVYPGTYYENLNINSKNITLSSLEMIMDR